MSGIQRGLASAMLVLTVLAAFAPAQTHSREIMAKPEAELIAIVANPNASEFDKAKACQRLALIGTKSAVPALAALLADEKLNVYARFGLEGIPDAAVDAALRQAASKLQGSQLVGVIDSIGQRKDSQAVGLLQGLLSNADGLVASAAAGALGRIGTADAAEVLKAILAKDSPLVSAAADACLACADGLAASGNASGAVALYEAVQKAKVPKYLKTAAIVNQCRLQGSAAKELLLAQIRNEDAAFFAAGLAVARTMPGAEVTLALANELGKLSPERQAALLLALADRADAPPQQVVLAASKSDVPAVREAAIRLLAKHGDASAAAILLDAALGDAEIAQTAKEGLRHLAGQEVDAAVLAKLDGAGPKAKIVLFELLAARRVAAALPMIRQGLGDSEESVRLAAIVALSQLADLSDLDPLADKALAGGDTAETKAAQAALATAAMRMSDRDACAAKLGKRLEGPAAHQAMLLELLTKVSGPKALEIVAATAKSSDPAIKDAATRALGQWLNADAAAALLDIAKNDADSKYRIRALRGYIRIARQLQMPAETKLSMFRTAMEVAQRDQEKQVALDILTRIPSAETLGIAASYVGEAALKVQASDAAVKIAAKIVGQQPKAVAEAMQKVVEANPEEGITTRAKQLLGQAQAASK